MKQRIILTLEPLPDSRPVEQRLRWALKTLLRRDKLRCIEHRLEQPSEQPRGYTPAGALVEDER